MGLVHASVLQLLTSEIEFTSTDGFGACVSTATTDQ